ncbi:MAG: HypC/HybG/HupF family hydrogenase formation chaperone [Rhodospirillales bacterium]|nr:HypC/HybG/HupF family hydrogenase formation chaperone [Rhodospirillales bacterium]
MCVGLPMQVIEVAPGRARCAARGETAWVDTALVGDIAPGTWLMTFLGSAREVITAETAHRTLDALAALEAALRGDHLEIDRLFADLVGREPRLPDHLLASEGSGS